MSSDDGQQKVLQLNEGSARGFDFSRIENNTRDDVLDKWVDDLDDPIDPPSPVADMDIPPGPPPPPPETPEERREKIRVRGKINQYLSSVFSEYLGNYKNLNFLSLSKSELDDVLEEIKFTVQTHEANSFNRESFLSLVSMGEIALVRNNVNCKGLTNNLSGNPKIGRLIEQISLDRDMYLRPEYQLVLLTAFAVNQTVTINNKLEEANQIAEKSRKPVPKPLKEKYKDLEE